MPKVRNLRAKGNRIVGDLRKRYESWGYKTSDNPEPRFGTKGYYGFGDFLFGNDFENGICESKTSYGGWSWKEQEALAKKVPQSYICELFIWNTRKRYYFDGKKFVDKAI